MYFLGMVLRKISNGVIKLCTPIILVYSYVPTSNIWYDVHVVEAKKHEGFTTFPSCSNNTRVQTADEDDDTLIFSIILIFLI